MARSRPAFTYPLAAFLGAALLRAMRLTWRIDESPKGYVAAEQSKRRALPGAPGAPGLIYLQWHSRILLGAATQAGHGVTVLISQHGDGEYIARTVERLGFRTARGSSSRGGARALRSLVDVLKSGGDAAVTPDGPKGPRLRVQMGAIEAASLTGAPIVPVALECRSAKRLRSWDRFMVPWFFTKVVVRFGEQIHVPKDLDDSAMERWRGVVEAAMHREHAAAATALGVAAETA